MAFRLTRAEIKQRDELADKLDEAAEALKSAVEAFNARLEEVTQDVSSALETYNEAVAEARSFMEDVASERQLEWEDKSERWQEGERGQAAQEWISAWESDPPEDVEIDVPEGIDEPDLAHAEALRDLPEEMDQ